MTFNDVTVTGDYQNTLVFIQGYTDFGGSHLHRHDDRRRLELGRLDGLYIDPSVGNPASPAPADGTNDIDLTGITFGGGTYGNFGVTRERDGVHQRLVLGNDDITGSTGNDIVFGLVGNDTASLGDGDDCVPERHRPPATQDSSTAATAATSSRC